MYLEKLIQNRYNKNIENNYYCQLNKFGENIYLHYLYPKLNITFYEDIENSLNIKIIPELKEFYSYYNGCKLFSESITIYGISTEDSFPFDFVINNLNKRAELKGCKDRNNYVFIGSVADLNMYYLQSEIPNCNIYLSKNGSTKVYQKFNSIKELITHYYKILENQYDDNGYRLNPNKGSLYKAFPVLSNKFINHIEKVKK